VENKKSTYTLEEAKRKMEKYCIYQDRCHQEIEKKLREMGMIKQASEVIQLHLMEHDFVNEERFARSFARGKFKIKKWGKKRIVNELKKREVSNYNIEAGLSEIDPIEYENTLDETGRRRFENVRETNTLKKRKKVADFLLRKGFESHKVYELVMALERENIS
jgi:regulatory protein